MQKCKYAKKKKHSNKTFWVYLFLCCCCCCCSTAATSGPYVLTSRGVQRQRPCTKSIFQNFMPAVVDTYLCGVYTYNICISIYLGKLFYKVHDRWQDLTICCVYVIIKMLIHSALIVMYHIDVILGLSRSTWLDREIAINMCVCICMCFCTFFLLPSPVLCAH